MEASEIWMGPLPDVVPGGLPNPRVAIAGIAIECSTFSPMTTEYEAFTCRRGEELLSYYPFFDEFRRFARWLPVMQARSLPGGAVSAEAYRRMKAEIIDGLRSEIQSGGPLDGLYFDIHGAMSVIGMEDAEADLAVAVRNVVGDECLISASMDLHGNVSRALLDQVDLITCYQMAPHEDEWNTKERAVWHLLERLRTIPDPAARRPWKAWLQVPVLLPGEKTSTRLEPAKSIYAQVPGVQNLDGVLDAAIWVGYAWADEPRCQAAIVVTGDDSTVCKREAQRLGKLYWDARADFRFVAPAMSLDDALTQALAPEAPRPFVISDSGDNPTAGGAGDVSWTLGELLRAFGTAGYFAENGRDVTSQSSQRSARPSTSSSQPFQGPRQSSPDSPPSTPGSPQPCPASSSSSLTPPPSSPDLIRGDASGFSQAQPAPASNTDQPQGESVLTSPGGTELTVIHASIFDPVAVAQAVEAGVGGEVTLDVGGHVDSGPSGPVRIAGTVFSLTEGDPVAGTQAVIKAGPVHAIITERRKPFHYLRDFRALGLEPERAEIVVVKIGYLEPELFELQRGWVLALTPGGVDQDLLRLGHHHLAPGVYPFEQDGPEPTLEAVVTRR
ncbi:MAG: M81 family metallopeptidase [Propionibacteriaceae bacterium]|jgi:microcystin degradation protein MlrC|nr:M81 family metallopeptidase [Propionibacteriaceae bacterium]